MVKVWLFKKFDIVGGENKRSKCYATQEAIRGIKSAERGCGHKRRDKWPPKQLQISQSFEQN